MKVKFVSKLNKMSEKDGRENCGVRGRPVETGPT